MAVPSSVANSLALKSEWMDSVPCYAYAVNPTSIFVMFISQITSFHLCIMSWGLFLEGWAK